MTEIHYSSQEPEFVEDGTMWMSHVDGALRVKQGGRWLELEGTLSPRSEVDLVEMFTNDPERLGEAFRKMTKAMIPVGEAATKAMRGLMKAMIAPHEGGWIESVGWVCERCGAETMDLEQLMGVPCE